MISRVPSFWGLCGACANSRYQALSSRKSGLGSRLTHAHDNPIRKSCQGNYTLSKSYTYTHAIHDSPISKSYQGNYMYMYTLSKSYTHAIHDNPISKSYPCTQDHTHIYPCTQRNYHIYLQKIQCSIECWYSVQCGYEGQFPIVSCWLKFFCMGEGIQHTVMPLFLYSVQPVLYGTCATETPYHCCIHQPVSTPN